jgi:hypothetical protein
MHVIPTTSLRFVKQKMANNCHTCIYICLQFCLTNGCASSIVNRYQTSVALRTQDPDSDFVHVALQSATPPFLNKKENVGSRYIGLLAFAIHTFRITESAHFGRLQSLRWGKAGAEPEGEGARHAIML